MCKIGCMTTDLSLTFDPDAGGWDIRLSGGDFQRTPSLSSAVILSLFSDGRATPNDLQRAGLDPNADPRGYWADVAESARQQWGSRLWLFHRRKLTGRTLADLASAARDALLWLIDEGTADDIRTAARQNGDNGAIVDVEIFLTGAGVEKYEFEIL